MNFIRGSHYPHHTYFAEECDKQGILFWSENCFWGIGGPQIEGYWACSAYPINEEDEYEFEESCIRTLKEMVRTNRNHPSIIVWSMSNEPFFSTTEVMDKAKELIKRLVQATHEIDPTRPAAVGGAQRGGFDTLGDLAGYNGDGASIFIDPGFPSFVSEYGSKIADRPGEYTPGFTDGVGESYQWRSGKAIWCGFHHGSIASNMGHMGMIDYYRLPLNTWYWYRENLLGIEPPKPVMEGVPYGLKLTADRTVISTDGTEDAHIVVTVVDSEGKGISNSMEVTLEISSGGAIFPTGKTFILSPEKNNLIEGMGAIELRSYFAGGNKIVAKAEGLVSGELIITAIGGEEWKNQVVNELLPPPSVMQPPSTDKSVSIGVDRPVFASSFHPDYPSRNATDGDWQTHWRPAEEKAGEWIMIDLEGTKKVSRADIIFEKINSEAFEISTSNDGSNFSTVAISEDGSINSFLNINLTGKSIRYLRIKFPKKPVGIRIIDLFT
jgi:beta-galactosidase